MMEEIKLEQVDTRFDSEKSNQRDDKSKQKSTSFDETDLDNIQLKSSESETNDKLMDKNINQNILDNVDPSSNDDAKVLKKNRPPPIDISESSSLNNYSGPKTPLTPGGQLTAMARRKRDKDRKIGHRRVDEQGQVTYKKIETSQICGSIQLGIGYAVGSLASKPERDLLMQDFAMVETTSFNSSGSNITPAHHFSDFKFKTYAPVAFRYFRDLFGIQPDDFLLSVVNEPMIELSNPGASGSVFYLTMDDEFIIKTVQHKEAEFLQKLLPGYYMNLNQNPRTLLPKFFGLYCYICGGKNVRVCVMNNLLPSSIKMHQKYDLKGSTYKRKANKHEQKKSLPTFKDLDFLEHHPDGLFLEAETYSALMKTINRDCRVLESFKIMDYSLLVGIHNLDLAAKEKLERSKEKFIDSSEDETDYKDQSMLDNEIGDLYFGESNRSSKKKSELARSKSINKQRLAAYSTAMESIHAEAEPIDEEEDVPPGGIPARNSKGERLLLFLGIIDILQSYRLKKKLEHTWKSMFSDGDAISVHRPSFYAQRFQDFMAKNVFTKIPSPLKHSPSKKKSHGQRFVKPSTSGNHQQNLPSTTLQQQTLKQQGSQSNINAIKDASSSSLISSSKLNTIALKNAPTTSCSSLNTPILMRKQRPTSPVTPHFLKKDMLRTTVIKQATNKHGDNSWQSASNSSINSTSNGAITHNLTGSPLYSYGELTLSNTEGACSLTASTASELSQ